MDSLPLLINIKQIHLDLESQDTRLIRSGPSGYSDSTNLQVGASKWGR